MRPAFAFCLVAFACGVVEPSAPEDLGPTGLLALPERGTQIASEVYELAAGAERTRCYHHNLHNAEPLDVEGFDTGQAIGQHHFNIFSSTLVRDDGFGACPNNEELFVGARPIVDGSSRGVRYRFPEGMALRLEPNTLLIFQLHSINTTPEPKAQQFVLNLHVRDTPAAGLVDIFGFTNFGIEIPPKQSAVMRLSCPVYDSIGLLTMSSHFHARGTGARAEVVREDGSAVVLYENERWDDPIVKVFDTAVRVGRGDTINFECSYKNDDDVTVRYGPSADDEMCFVFGYYFPKVGLIPCF